MTCHSALWRQKDTTTRDDFQAWGVHTRQPIIHGEAMCKSSGKIEDLTTFRVFTRLIF